MDALKEIYWLLGGLSECEARGLVKVDRRTFRRWIRGESRIPYSARRCLEVDAAGFTPKCAGNGWHNWRFAHGKIFDPETDRDYTAGDLRSIFWMRQELEAHRRDKKKREHLQRQRDNIRDLKPKRGNG